MSTVNFNDQIFVQEALQALTAVLTPLKIFTRDLSSQSASKGNAIIVPLVSNVTATTFASSYTGTGGTVSSVTVNLNNHNVATVDLTDVQMKNSSAAVFDNFARQLGQALGKTVLTNVWSNILTTNFAAAAVTTRASADWSKTDVRALRLKMSQLNVPRDNRAIVVNEVVHDALLADSNIVQMYQYGGTEGIREGQVPRLLGFDVYTSNILPSNSISLTAFACHQDAIVVAMRSLIDVVPAGYYEDIRNVTDPDSGISFTWRRLYNPLTGIHYLNAECLYGYATGLTTNLVIATTATS